MAIPLPNQIPHASKVRPSRGASASTDRSPQKTIHTITEGVEGRLDPYVCSCGDSFVSEDDSYRHIKATKPAFVRPDHLHDRPLREHAGLEALKKSLEGERKRPQKNTRRQPRRAN